MDKNQKKQAWRSRLTLKQIFTIPNILSFFRLALVPVIVWLYCFEKSLEWTILVILISGLTDIVDGFIARKFNMITDFGKFIDPVADKVTQGIVLICLLTQFPLMWLPLGILIVKETISFILRFVLFNRAEELTGAEWHGKLATVALYLIMCLHIVWPIFGSAIPTIVSLVCILVTSGIMLLSFALYTISILASLKATKKDK